MIEKMILFSFLLLSHIHFSHFLTIHAGISTDDFYDSPNSQLDRKLY